MALQLVPTSSVPETAPASAGPRLEPLVNVWWELNYRCLRCLHVWNIAQTDESIVTLVCVCGVCCVLCVGLANDGGSYLGSICGVPTGS